MNGDMPLLCTWSNPPSVEGTVKITPQTTGPSGTNFKAIEIWFKIDYPGNEANVPFQIECNLNNDPDNKVTLTKQDRKKNFPKNIDEKGESYGFTGGNVEYVEKGGKGDHRAGCVILNGNIVKYKDKPTENGPNEYELKDFILFQWDAKKGRPAPLSSSKPKKRG